MKLSTNQLKGIVDTLPIGFYCGRQIPVELDEKITMSCYMPVQDCIKISVEQLSLGLEMCDNMDEATTVIRGNFYHELSHAILTPKEMKPTDAINIMEDERIERICKNTYYGVDFKSNVLKLNGGEESFKEPPRSAQEAFYRLVRFGIGDKKFLNRVDNIIHKYSHLSRNSDLHAYNSYVQDIRKLYYDFTGEYDQEREEQMYGEGEEASELTEEEKEALREATGRAYKPDKGEEKGFPSLKRVAERALAITFNQEFHQKAEMLFNNYRKKNSKGGSLNGYSGVMNPRTTGREDFRFFERPSPLRGGNPYGTLHLNLYIDTSGSFCGNDDATNAILRSLAAIERKNPNFSFDVVTTGPDEILLDHNSRYIDSCGGNHLSKKIHTLFRKLQTPQTGNYNIILFDGDAYSNDCSQTSDWYSTSENGKGFSAFANNTCTIITDPSNRKYIERYCPNTHTIYTTNYVKELYENVLKALQRALI